jgi:NADPH-dependent 2,4-dienoyl-CoA reductase/sulfur reductase-like enzyme
MTVATMTVRPQARDRVVVVGAGLAGLRATERLRELGFAGSITMVGDEHRPPYNRTPLSKQLVEGRLQPRDLTLDSYVELDATMLLGHRAVKLDTERRVVRLDDQRELHYDGLIIASGASARIPPDMPRDSRVQVLRTIEHCRAIDAALARARRVVIVGGGFIGCELASSLRKRSLPVTLIDMADVLMRRPLGPALGALLTQLHVDAGVDLRLGRCVQRWTSGRDGVTLHLDDDTSVQGDAVVVAVGTVPNTDWLKGSCLDVTDGVLCDPSSHAEGVQDVVAAGDVARWPNLRFDSTPRRVEHWVHAVEHAQAAATNLLAGPGRAAPFMPLPRFWSEQHGLRIQAVGMPGLHDEVQLVHGAVEQRRLVAGYFRGPQLVGAVGLDSPRHMQRMAFTVAGATQRAADEATERHESLASL